MAIYRVVSLDGATDVKRDGRSLAHNILEEMRMLALQRMNDGEHPDAVSASFGMHRSWAYKLRAKARGRGRGARYMARHGRQAAKPPS